MLLLSTFGPHAVLTSVEWHQTHRSPLQLSKRFFWAETRYAYGQSISPTRCHFGQSEKRMSVCHAKTKDSRDAQPLPTKMLERLLFIRTTGFQLQYPYQTI